MRCVMWVWLGLLLGASVQAQELDCTVTVDYSALQRSDLTYLDEFREEIRRYLNDQAWSEDRYEPEERIGCSFGVVFTAVEGTARFTASLLVTSRRPIYGTLQMSNILQLRDEAWQFEYVPGTPFIRDYAQYSPLTTLLDFYALLVLGFDYDSFDLLGGERFFTQAREIADRAQGLAAPGWVTFGGTVGRTQLIQQLTDPRYRPLRSALFDLHHRGLDHFLTDQEAARTAVLEGLQGVHDLFEEVNRQYALDVFFTTKSAEVVSMLERSQQGRDAYSLLVAMDPPRAADYARLLN